MSIIETKNNENINVFTKNSGVSKRTTQFYFNGGIIIGIDSDNANNVF